MSWLLEGSNHEGCVVEVNSSGGHAESEDTETGLINFDDGTTLPESEISGWQLTCQCGWQSMFWPKTNTEYDEQHMERNVQGHAFWLEHLNSSGVREDLIEIMRQAERAQNARRTLDQAVATARGAGATWEEVGRAADMTRQSAHERWS